MPSARAHDGAPIDVQVRGSGPTVLTHTMAIYTGLAPESVAIKTALDQALVDSLAERYRLVLIEYPGRPKPRSLTPANVVADLLAIADAVGAERFAWCGYSWTAVIGLQLAVATDRLTALVCGGWPPVGGPFDAMLASARERRIRPPAGPDAAQQFVTFYEAIAGFDDEAAQPQITCPRLCFAGGADDIYGLGIGRVVGEQRARLERLGWDVSLLDGLDHMDLLEPEVFVPLVDGWLDERLAP